MFLSPNEDLKFIEDGLESTLHRIKGNIFFISGSTGFIGKCLVETLVWINRSKKLNIKIYSISRNPEAFFIKYPHFRGYDEFILLKGNIRDKTIPFDEVSVDSIIHAATDVVSESSPEEIFESCIYGTQNILKFAKVHSCKRILLLSSGAVYGILPDELNAFMETYKGGIDLSSPKSAYALGKKSSEWMLQQYVSEATITIARCFAFVGPYLPLDSHFAIGNFIRDVMMKKDIEIKGDGTPLRSYLYTADLCLWLLKILFEGESGEVFNVGGNEAISIENLASVIKEIELSDVEIQIHQISTSSSQDKYLPNIDKIFKRFNLRQSVNLRQAIQKTILWNRAHGNVH
jgi:dTDP-glucose 4,6-dehydratase